MSKALLKAAKVLFGFSKSDKGKKVIRNVLLAFFSPLIAIVIIIGAIFSDGIGFNHNLVSNLVEGWAIDDLADFSQEQLENISKIQEGVKLIENEIPSVEETLVDNDSFNVTLIKAYYVGIMFSKQKLYLSSETAKSYVECFTITDDKGIHSTKENKTIYSNIQEKMGLTLTSETKELMKKVYDSYLGGTGDQVVSLSKEDIENLINNMPKDTSEIRKKIVLQAADAVGKIPYYWGGTAECKGYEGNDFGKKIKADEKGRNKKGLDCSHFVDWVYWTVMDNNLGNTNTTGQIKMCKKIKKSELKPGDLAFLINSKGKTTHVGIYAGLNEKGNAVWIHENSKDSNVAMNTVSYWNGYYRFNIMQNK